MLSILSALNFSHLIIHLVVNGISDDAERDTLY